MLLLSKLSTCIGIPGLSLLCTSTLVCWGRGGDSKDQCSCTLLLLHSRILRQFQLFRFHNKLCVCLPTTDKRMHKRQPILFQWKWKHWLGREKNEGTTCSCEYSLLLSSCFDSEQETASAGLLCVEESIETWHTDQCTLISISI